MGAPRCEREGETARSLYKKKKKKNTQRIEGVELVRLDRRPTRFGHRPPGQALIGGGEGSEFRGVVGLKGGNGKKGWRVESETRAKTRRGAPPPLNLFSLSLSLFSLVTSFTKGDRSPAGRAASAAALASSSARIFRRRARAAGTRAQGEREKVGGGEGVLLRHPSARSTLFPPSPLLFLPRSCCRASPGVPSRKDAPWMADARVSGSAPEAVRAARAEATAVI